MSGALANLYTPTMDAARELQARRKQSPLSKRSHVEHRLAQRPYAVLFRQVATPNFELERFITLARSACLTPLVLEFHRDRFVSRNKVKQALVRMGFDAGVGRNGGARISFLSVADIPANDGLPLSEATTVWGQGLVTLHRELLAARPSLGMIESLEGSDWFLAHRSGARQYYADFLSLFVRHAVLFESFLLSPEEHCFTTEVVLPAFQTAAASHGLRPLVCRLDPEDSEGHPHWLHYPAALHSHVAPRMQARLSPQDSNRLRRDAQSDTQSDADRPRRRDCDRERGCA